MSATLTSSPYDYEAMSHDAMAAILAHPDARARCKGHPGTEGYKIAFCNWLRGDKHASAAVWLIRNDRGELIVIGKDQGTDETWSPEDVAAMVDLDREDYQHDRLSQRTNGHHVAPVQLQLPPSNRANSTAKTTTIAELAADGWHAHEYRDRDGNLVFVEIRRYVDNGAGELRKEMRQLAALGSDEHLEWGLPDALKQPGSRPLYKLPELLAWRGQHPNGRVVVVEGAKCCDALAAALQEQGEPWGETFVTTTSQGAGGVRYHDLSPLAGLDVVILPDHDQRGAEYADAIAAGACEVGASHIRIVPMPGEAWGEALPGSGGRDIADYLAESRSLNDIWNAMLATPELTPPPRVSGLVCPFDHDLSPKVEWLRKPFLQRGAVHVVVGSSESGKTLWALTIANDLARDGSVVLYCALEGHPSLATYQRAYLKHHSLSESPKGLMRWTPDALDLRKPVDVESLLAAVTEHGADLVIIDTLNQAMPGTDESTADMGAAVNAAARIARQTGAAVLILHHFGKDRGRGGRGGLALLNNSDMQMVLDHDRGSALHTLTAKGPHTKARGLRDDERGPWTWDRRTIDLGFDEDGDPLSGPVLAATDRVPLHRPKLSPAVRKTLLVLQHGPLSWGDWMQAGSIPKATLSKAMNAGVEQGLIEQQGSLYSLTNAGCRLLGIEEGQDAH